MGDEISWVGILAPIGMIIGFSICIYALVMMANLPNKPTEPTDTDPD